MESDEETVETQQWQIVDIESGHLILQMDVVRVGTQVLYVDPDSIESNEHSEVSMDIFGGELTDGE